TSCPPLRKPPATVRIGVSMRPEMNVKPKSAATPHALLRRSVTTHNDPIMTASIRSGVMIGEVLKAAMKLSCIPANAPAIVGSSDRASSQYVLRRTRLESTAIGIAAGCIAVGVVLPPDITGSNLESIVPSISGLNGLRRALE